jgi:hypothetical protein
LAKEPNPAVAGWRPQACQIPGFSLTRRESPGASNAGGAPEPPRLVNDSVMLAGEFDRNANLVPDTLRRLAGSTAVAVKDQSWLSC